MDKLLATDQQHMELSLSIVSHGQGEMICNLLGDIGHANFKNYEILITLNYPEDEAFLDAYQSLPVKIIRNTQRKGFGHNHNEAFRQSSGKIFVILNPDIRFQDQPFDDLWLSLQQPGVAACAPLVRSPSGQLEDSARTFPSFFTIVSRYIAGTKKITTHYDFSTGAVAVDWAAGMFIAFKRDAYQLVSGFDQSYFMYYEDVDICMRLKFAGYKVIVEPKIHVVHDAQRASRRKFSYLRWHFVSAIRFTTKHFIAKIRHHDQRTS